MTGGMVRIGSIYCIRLAKALVIDSLHVWGSAQPRGLATHARPVVGPNSKDKAGRISYLRNKELLPSEIANFGLARIAIIGRPNVGKSSLFNALTHRRAALVHDSPNSHVTRDYKEAVATLSDLRFVVVDTSGLEPFMSRESIQGRATGITRSVRDHAETYHNFAHIITHDIPCIIGTDTMVFNAHCTVLFCRRRCPTAAWIYSGGMLI